MTALLLSLLLATGEADAAPSPSTHDIGPVLVGIAAGAIGGVIIGVGAVGGITAVCSQSSGGCPWGQDGGAITGALIIAPAAGLALGLAGGFFGGLAGNAIRTADESSETKPSR